MRKNTEKEPIMRFLIEERRNLRDAIDWVATMTMDASDDNDRITKVVKAASLQADLEDRIVSGEAQQAAADVVRQALNRTGTAEYIAKSVLDALGLTDE